MANPTIPQWIYDLSFEDALKYMLFGMFGSTAPTGTGLPVTPGGGSGTDNVNLAQVGGATFALGGTTPALSLPVTPSKWVRHSVSLGASASQAIPSGAIYQYSVLTGTAGDGTMTGLPAGYSDSSVVPIVTGFTVTTASASSAAVVWFTAT